MQDQWIINSGELEIVFDRNTGILPRRVSVRNFAGTYEQVIDGNKSSFSVRNRKGVQITPVITGTPDISHPEENCTRVVFDALQFKDSSGRIIPGLKGYADYDFFEDGTAFAGLCFLIPPEPESIYQDLILELGTDTERFDDIRWAWLHRLEQIDGAIIQTLGPERYLERGLDKTFDEIAPVISFNGRRNGGESLYMEFFMEGGASLDGQRDRGRTEVKWQGNTPSVRWNFQKVPASKPQLGMQFRNHWGWVIKTPPKTRHLPPLVMYHYLDNSLHYPSMEELDAMADSGCRVLVMHENWRYDVQNGGIPYDRERFQALVEAAHKRNIRIAVYIRGNENSVQECACNWFGRYLKKDFDGLYIDYGSPVCYVSAPDETYPNGRINFRTHYNYFKKLREQVGQNGLMYSHTGPVFSGVSMSFSDGYVSGEGEKGLLIASRAQHEYFSMAPLCCGTMWTAAFPEYSTEKMIPFLAATGQYPHSTLGTQVSSSSLTHPGEPGINDRCFRPLWKLWQLMEDEKDLWICNDYNSTGVFPADSLCGHALLIGRDRQKALYVVSNFSDREQTFDVTPCWEKSGFDPAGKNCFFLAPEKETPGCEVPYSKSVLQVTLAPYSCAGFFWNSGETDFSQFRKPYHQPCSSGIAYLKDVALQKELRQDPPRWKDMLLTVHMSPMDNFGYEDSLIVDLFDNDSYLVEFDDSGSMRKLVKITTKEGKSLFAGESSQVIDLQALLSPGRHHLGIYATHLGEDFYSFFSAVLSDKEGNACTLLYRNDCEPDRAFLHFDVIIP
ncbi:MAG: hypothetical protein IKC65_00590 [Lentisphaeria bacterium]|nr:hypothetical protein [Lentisphaeria bacterium]